VISALILGGPAQASTVLAPPSHQVLLREAERDEERVAGDVRGWRVDVSNAKPRCPVSEASLEIARVERAWLPRTSSATNSGVLEVRLVEAGFPSPASARAENSVALDRSHVECVAALARNALTRANPRRVTTIRVDSLPAVIVRKYRARGFVLAAHVSGYRVVEYEHLLIPSRSDARLICNFILTSTGSFPAQLANRLADSCST
jgi:hypothetical protein